MLAYGTEYPEPGLDDAPPDERPDTGAVVVRLADVRPERVAWLWDGWLPCGKLVTLDGDPGLGKSTLALTFAAHVSTGQPWPDATPCPEGGVLLLSAEDGLADTIRPRLDAASADTTRVHALTGVPYVDEDGAWHERPPVVPRDVPLVEQLVRRHGVRLVVVDVLMAYLDGQVNAHRDQDVRRALAPLAALADRTGATVLVLRHLNKATGSPVLYRGGGSIGIVGAARVGLVTVLDPDDEDEQRRILAVSKNNLAPLPAFRSYQLTDDPRTGVARVEWLGEDGRRLDDLMAHHDHREGTETADAAAWLVEYLTDCGGEAHSEDAKRAARAAGLAVRTVERARDRAGVVSQRQGFGKGARYVWALDGAASSPHARHARQAPGLGEQGEHVAGIGASPNGRRSTDLVHDASRQACAPTAPSALLRAPCAGCGEPLTAVEPGQTHHPGCRP